MEHRFRVSGMTCGHCIRAVTQAIHRLDAAARVMIDLDTGTVRVGSHLSPTLLADAIRGEGYEVDAG